LAQGDRDQSGAVLYVTHPVLKSMIARSTADGAFRFRCRRVGQRRSVYSATRAESSRSPRSLARENGAPPTSTSTACRPPTETPLLKQEIIDNPELIKRMVRLIPSGASPSRKTAATVSFLLSPDADYITGQTISVSGGLVMI